MYCKNYGAVKKTDVVNTKKVYSVITNFKAETVKNLCDLKFRKIAELFYFVMCLPAGAALIIQNINNICKSTVN